MFENFNNKKFQKEKARPLFLEILFQYLWGRYRKLLVKQVP